MSTEESFPINIPELNAKLRNWQKKHDTPERVAASHRKVLLERIVQSMSFENQPVSASRLKVLLRERNLLSDETS
ncbi:MAG: hypothetical protein LLH30_04545 [Candidatus Manganitrophus sp. SA1]|nr:hypothetical protein [Candidatus Manganitrophus morganii]